MGRCITWTSVAFCLGVALAAHIEQPVSYSGHKVLSVTPKTESDLQLLRSWRNEHGVDLWNEPGLNKMVMMRLPPNIQTLVLQAVADAKMESVIAFHDLQSVINEEKVHHAPSNVTFMSTNFDFGKYHTYDEIVKFLKDLTTEHSNLAKLETIGTSYENRPIYVVRITSGQFGTKPVIMLESGLHAREWTSVASAVYILNELLTKYGSDPEITTLVDQYEFYIIAEANPDGYIFTWNVDRLWRKTRSRSTVDWLGNCRGADANRNFDIEHCGVGTSRKPCDEIYCGDSPFSESESRAIRDLMITIGKRMKLYITIHAFSQLWMTPYGINKSLPPNYKELLRVGTAGATALSKRYGTQFRVGSIANIIYEAAGSSVDYAYSILNIPMAFALELRDTGRYGFFLPPTQISAACEETLDGIIGAILAL